MLFLKRSETDGTLVHYTPVVSIVECHSTADYRLTLADGERVVLNEAPNEQRTQFYLTAMANNLVHII